NNALLGYVGEIEISVLVPQGVNYVPSSSFLQYPGPEEFTDTPGSIDLGSLGSPEITQEDDLSVLTWDISLLLSDLGANLGLPGAQLPNENVLLASIDLQTSCDFIAGSTVQMRVNATRPCGEPIPTIQSAPIEVALQDASPTFSTETNVQIQGNLSCDNTVLVDVSIVLSSEDIGTQTNGSEFLELSFPSDFEFISGSLVPILNANDLAANPIIAEVDNTMNLSWDLPQNLVDGDEVHFNFEVDASALPIGEYNFGFNSVEIQEITCSGDECSVSMQMESVEWDVSKGACLQEILAVNDTFFIAINEPVVLSVLVNEHEQNLEVLNSTFDILNYPENAVVFEMNPGTFEYTPNQSWTGLDSMQYEICNSLSCDTAWVFITVYDPVSECNNLFFDDAFAMEIENCESEADFCLPITYETLDQYQVLVDGDEVSDFEICNLLEFTAYDMTNASWAQCVPEQQFPIEVLSWTIQGEVYAGTVVNSFGNLPEHN
ncbi:MAG: Ig-like domain-containing protein, partial [Flavobacteriales bacterium]